MSRPTYSEDGEPTVLDVYFQELSPNRYLEEKITNSILSEEEIADAASPELADIRRHIRACSSKVRDILQKLISSSQSKYLQESIITMRSGRYVVPVRSECKNEIPGLVHDLSGRALPFHRAHGGGEGQQRAPGAPGQGGEGDRSHSGGAVGGGCLLPGGHHPEL